MMKKLVKQIASEVETKIFKSVFENLKKIVPFRIPTSYVRTEIETNNRLSIRVYIPTKLVSIDDFKNHDIFELTFDRSDRLFQIVAKETNSIIDINYDANNGVFATVIPK